MPIEQRPSQEVNTETAANLFRGLPFVEFAPETSPGVFDPFRQLGVVDSAELQKTIELATLRSFQSGFGSVVRELVGSLEARLQIGVFDFVDKNLQLFLGSATLVENGATPTAITDDRFTVPSGFPNQFTDLTFNDITTEPLTDLKAETITDELVGTGQGGTFGETSGDFALDFGVLLVTDITEYTETASNGTVTDRTADLVAGAPAAGQIGVVVGAVSGSGDLEYFTGEAPAAGTVIRATYTPTHTFTNGTDYLLDLTDGKIRMLDTNKVKTSQALLADYTYNQAASTTLQPFTQTTFAGRTRIKQLTSVGINFVWNVPRSSIRLTDDPFTWVQDDFATGSLILNILDAGGADPFGTFETFSEVQANA